MKNILLLIFLIIFCNCFSQNNIFVIDDYGADEVSGSYRKDIQNEFDKFVGTWRYEDAYTNVSFIITLKKAARVPIDSGSDFYEDLVFGDYSYSAFGIEVVNTLPNLADASMSPYDHSIVGNFIQIPEISPVCIDCTPGERRLNLIFKDSQRPYMYSFLMLRYRTVLGAAKLKVLVYSIGSILPDENSPTTLRVPYSEYTMKKVLE